MKMQFYFTKLLVPVFLISANSLWADETPAVEQPGHFNASSVQGYAGAASAVAGAAQSSSGAGQVLGVTGGLIQAYGTYVIASANSDPDPASKTAQIATGNKLLLIGTLASIGGTVAGSNGKDLNSLSKEITDNPSYGGADGTGGGNCSGGIYDYADGCTGPPGGNQDAEDPLAGDGNNNGLGNSNGGGTNTTGGGGLNIKIPDVFGGNSNLPLSDKMKIKEQLDDLNKLGITYDEENGGFNTPSGFISNDTLNDPNTLNNIIAGLPPGEFRNNIKQAQEDLNAAKANVSAMAFNNPSGFGGYGGKKSAGKGGGTAGGDYKFDLGGSSLYKSLLDRYKNKNKQPASKTVEGKAVLLSDGKTAVGVMGDNIFEMMHRRYFTLGRLNELDP